MNSMIIPSSPNWYGNSILACSQDNTLVYGARNDIIYIQNDKKIPDVKIILKAHSKRLLSVDVNNQWGNPNKYFVSVGEDKIVKLWNATNLSLENSHKVHEKTLMPVDVKFSGENRVVSISEEGNIVIWNIKNSATNLLKDLYNVRSRVTCMSMCPHASWLAAVGLENGLVIVVDIRKNGTVMHRLPGHQNAVVSLAWCPAPVNIFPKNPTNYVSYKKVDEGPSSTRDEGTSSTRDDDTSIIKDESPSITRDEGTSSTKDDCPSESTTTESGDHLNPETSVPSVSTSTEVHETPVPSVDNLDDTNSQPEKQEVEVQGDDEHSKQKNEGASETLKPKQVQETPRREFLLASSGKDGKIYIWRAGTDGVLQTFITSKSSKGKYRPKVEKMWLPLYWPTPTALITTSKIFELIQYTLPKPFDASRQTSVIHDCHQSTVFCIAGPTVVFTEENWLDAVPLNAWTFSQDHVLVNVSLGKERKILTHYPTFDGVVNCLSASPVNPTRLAIGTNHLKMWNISSSKSGIINMSKYCQKMHSKIVRLAWHPSLESVFAFATSEGRICYMDTNKSEIPKILRNHYKHQINKLEWGPVDQVGRLGLYILSGGELVAFDINNSDNSKVVIDQRDVPYIYTFSWKPNHDIMFVACKTGAIVTYSKNLKKSSVMYFESKTESIVWHPQAAATGNSKSPYHNYCATVRNGNNVIVHDFRSGTLEVVSQYSAKGALVTAVAWNPFHDRFMVICANSGVAEVYDVAMNCVVSTCVDSFFDPIVCAIWSPISEDCIIMGCKENALKIWKISEHNLKNQEEVTKLRDIAYKELHSRSEESINVDDDEIKLSTEDSKDSRPDKMLPKTFHIRDADHLIINIRKVINWQKNAEGDTPKPDILCLFTDSDCMDEMLKLNEETHVQRKKFDKAITLSLFRGDVSSSIQAAINEHRVTPSIITLAPLVSTKMWQDACEMYAKQLAEEPNSDPVEIAVHYLACHKIHEAIDVLCEANMHQEAFALAKCRLPEEYDIITNIVNKWTISLIQHGNYEFAAVCYVYLEKYEEAAVLLFKRSGKILELAAELAALAGNKTLEEAILARCAKLKDAKKETPLLNRADLLLKQREDAKSKDSTEHEAKLSVKCEDEGENKTVVVAELANKEGTKASEEVILTHGVKLVSDPKIETALLARLRILRNQEEKTPAPETKLLIKNEDEGEDKTFEVAAELANIAGSKPTEETILTHSVKLVSEPKIKSSSLFARLGFLKNLEEKTPKDDSIAPEAKLSIKSEGEVEDKRTEDAAELANIAGSKAPEETILTHSVKLVSDPKKEASLLAKVQSIMEREEKVPKGDDSTASEDKTTETAAELAVSADNKAIEEAISTCSTKLVSDTKKQTPLLDKGELVKQEEKTVEGDETIAEEAKLSVGEDEDKTAMDE